MTEVRTQPVKAQRFEDIDDVRGKPGAFEFYKHGERYPAGMLFSCPCGCKLIASLAFRPASKEDRASWEWDGDIDAPTLSPSVHNVGHWHGWLKNGVWESV